CGSMCSGESCLESLSEALTTPQVIAFYDKIRLRSPHRESEFRPEFERGFARHAAALPPPFTRRHAMWLLGIGPRAARWLLDGEPMSDGLSGNPREVSMSIEYSFRLVPATVFDAGPVEEQGYRPDSHAAEFTILRGAEYPLHRVFLGL